MNGVQTRLKCKPNVKRCKRFVFAAHSPLLHPNTLKTKAIIHFQTDHILTRFVFPPLVQCKDGNIYTVETTKDGKNNLVRINADFSLKKVAMRDDYSPSSFGAYREASFCGTPEGIFYYIAGGKIYKATFDNPAPEETLTEYTKEGYGFYGAGIRVNPKTNELLAMYLTGDYQKNLLVRFNAATGEKISEIAYDGYYFPATFIFN